MGSAVSGSHHTVKFIEMIGKGGFGSVYVVDIVKPKRFRQRCAIKILSVEMSQNQDVAARQRDEARLLGQLNHDHIVNVMDLIEIDQRPAVIMEYIEGADAQQLLRAGPLPPRATAELISAAASALEAAYEMPSPHTKQPLRVIHRDIKPANLLVSRNGGIKVLDFGIARADFDREGKTSSVMYGTLRYLAPEQWLYRQVSSAVDVYALGVTIIELLTATAFEQPPLMQDAYQNHIEPFLDRLPPSPWMTRARPFIAQMLAYDPEARPSAGEVHDHFLTLIDDAPGHSIRRLARERIPPLIDARRSHFKGQALPPDITFSQPDINTHRLSTAPEVDAKVEADGADTLFISAQFPVSAPARKNHLPLMALTALVGLCIMLVPSLVALMLFSEPVPTREMVTPEAVSERTPPAEVTTQTTPLQEAMPPEPAAEEAAHPPVPVEAPEETSPELPPAASLSPSLAPDRGPERRPAPEPGPTRTITVTGPTLDSTIFVDREQVGTHHAEVSLPYGKHELTVFGPSGQSRLQITVGETTSPFYRWRLNTDGLRGYSE